MRDFRDAKAMARTLRTALAAKGLNISNSDSLELIAQAFGLRDWNTLSAMLGAEPPKPPGAAASSPPPTAGPPLRPGHAALSRDLEATLDRVVALVAQRRHQYATPEHLLLVLADDPDAAAVLAACEVDKEGLKTALAAHLDTALSSVVVEDADVKPEPTSGFQRIIQRAVIHVRSAGGGYVTGANVLVAIFSERDSRAAGLLLERKMTRYDAVNFIAHGVAKGGGTAAA